MVRYFIDSDDSGHHYFIPLDRKANWDAWLELDDDDERSWDEPKYAERIDGGTLTFTDPRIE